MLALVAAITSVTATSSFAAFSALSWRLLNMAFRFRKKCFTRKSKLAGFLIHFDKLHLYLISFFENTLHAAKSFPSYFRNVKQAVLTRNDFNKCTEVHYAL